MRESTVTDQEGRRYDITRRVGRGGFGDVYRASMISRAGVRQDVAIKVLHADVDPRSQAVARLQDEARMLGIVRHPAIVRVHDLVVLHGRLALVTEFVEGQDLDGCVRGGLSLRAVVEVVGQVAEALDAAWEARDGGGPPLRLVHRDIKPSNIRIGRHGEVKLLDFGIARADLPRAARTATATLVGSLLYMAPERLHGSGDGAPADVYALGATLFQSVGGEPLFEGLGLERQYALCFDGRAHAAFVDDRVESLVGAGPELVQLLRRLLDHEPDRRPTARELARACDDLAGRLPGASLRAWCRDRVWPEPEDVPDPLDDHVAPATLADQPAPPVRGGSFEGVLPRVAVGAAAGLVVTLAVVAVVALLAVAVVVGSSRAPGEGTPVAVVAPEPIRAGPVSEPAPAPAPEPVVVSEPDPEPVIAAPAPAVPPAPRVTPAPRPAPVVASPAPAPVARDPGVVEIDGDVGSVAFVRGGVDHTAGLGPGEVETIDAGVYTVTATFERGTVELGPVEVPAGGGVVVRCSSGLMRCLVKPR